jgi:hypothetical protein
MSIDYETPKAGQETEEGQEVQKQETQSYFNNTNAENWSLNKYLRRTRHNKELARNIKWADEYRTYEDYIKGHHDPELRSSLIARFEVISMSIYFFFFTRFILFPIAFS